MSSDLQSPNPKLTGDVQAELKQLGKYRIVRKIGAGGMGTVYLAEDTLLKRTVALKVLPKDRAENPILVRRFQSEARASAQLTHKNIVGVFDAGQADGYLYIALEYIEGSDLHEWLKKRETIPIKRSIAIIKQMAEALQHAHEKKLVHRDIKPANIMIAKDGTAKLADLGLARSIDETLDTTITRVGTTVGTVDYMSPEQAAHSKHADIRSDIYSLGCTWYHMLTGSPPFPDGDLTNKLRAHADNPIPDPCELNSRVTESIVAIMHRMMAKKKQDRYQRPRDLLDDLNNSSNLDADSGNLLATILEEDESASEIDSITSDDSVDIDVQEESQSKLLKESESRKAPSTTPTLPQKNKPQKTRQKKKPRTKAQKDHPTATAEEEQVDDRPASRKHLKRARSAEELNEPEFATKIPQQPPQPAQKPNQKEAGSSKQAKKKPSAAKVEKTVSAQPTQKSKAGKSSPQKPQTQKPQPQKPQSQKTKSQKPQSQKQTSLPSVELNSNFGIDVDWAKTAVVILIVAITIGLIWWGISKFPGDAVTPNVNPYGENVGSNSSAVVDNADEPHLENAPQDNDERADRSNQTRLTSQSDEQIDPPKWIVRGGDRPTLKQQDQLKVQRGRKGRGTFLNLEDSLAAVQDRPTVIDLSAVESQEIRSINLKLKNRLTIQATRFQPVLTFHHDQSDEKKGSYSWLNVTGGTLELVGLHFIISNSTKNKLNFLKLNGTDLILRDCTFTTIGQSPVTCVNVGLKSANGNRVHIENCLMRGENFSVVNAENVSCDIYCENSFFASQENNLIRVSLGKYRVQQSVHITNCTLLGSAASLQIDQAANSRIQSVCNLTLNRSLLMGTPSTNTTAIQVLQSTPAKAEKSTAKKQNINLKMRHVRFVNTKDLTVVGTKDKAHQTVSDPTQWSKFWGVTLPSDDLVHLDNAEDILSQPSLMTANDISRRLGDLARPGVGERSLLGADPTQVATLDAAAVNRAFALNKIRQRAMSQKKILWTGKAIRFDLNSGTGLAKFLASSKCPNGTTVTCFGSGIRKIPSIILKNRKLRLRFEQSKGNPLRIVSADNQTVSAMFVIDGGEFAIERGRFEFRKSNVGKDSAIFLESKNGAAINLNQVQVSQSLDIVTETSLIALGPAKQTNVVFITSSMISGFGPLVDFDATNQSLTLSNVVLVSGSDSLSMTSSQNPGMLSLNHCTFSQNKAAIHCQGANAPITTFSGNCLFAPPPKLSQQASIIRGDSTDEIHQTVDWWESSCGYNSKIPTGVSVPGKKPIGSFKTAWKTFWGSHRVHDLLDGTREVVMARKIQDIDQLDVKDFVVSGSCQAAVWADDGKSIGARISTIGPQLISEKPAPSKRPKQTNTPAGF